MKSKKTEVPEMLLDFYRRELRRMIGMSKFDYALVFTDMKNVLSCNVRGLWM